VRLNGTYDIAYDDGEAEQGVAADMIRSLGGGRSSSPRGRDEILFRIGDSVDADFRGRGKYYPGKISRVHFDGTYDIDYDDGEFERNVVSDRIRHALSAGKGKSRTVDDDSPRAFRIGDPVEADYQGRGRYYPGKISRVRLNGEYDIAYDNGDSESGVSPHHIRSLDRRARSFDGDRDRHSDRDRDRDGYGESKAPSSSRSPSRRRPNELAHRRAAYYDQEARDEDPPEALFRRGDRVACYWYRHGTAGAAKDHARPKAATVSKFNADGTYTVAMELGGHVIDDVPPEFLKRWEDGTVDLRLGGSAAPRARSASPTKPRVTDKWAAVFEMSRQMVKQGASRHVVPEVEDVDGLDLSADEKLRRIVGNELYRDFQDAFEREDRHREGELDAAAALRAFSRMGGKASDEELRIWAKGGTAGGRAQKAFDFPDFVLAHANIFHPPRAGRGNPLARSRDEDVALGKTLRLTGEWRTLGGFARVFGKRHLRDLERAFDAYADKDDRGDTYLRASDVLEAFHRLGRAVTVTRLQVHSPTASITPPHSRPFTHFPPPLSRRNG